MKSADILGAVAVALEASTTALRDVAMADAMRGAAVVMRAVADLLTDRTPAECLAILEQLRDSGTQPISASDLDAQTVAIIDRTTRG